MAKMPSKKTVRYTVKVQLPRQGWVNCPGIGPSDAPSIAQGKLDEMLKRHPTQAKYPYRIDRVETVTKTETVGSRTPGCEWVAM